VGGAAVVHDAMPGPAVDEPWQRDLVAQAAGRVLRAVGLVDGAGPPLEQRVSVAEVEAGVGGQVLDAAEDAAVAVVGARSRPPLRLALAVADGDPFADHV